MIEQTLNTLMLLRIVMGNIDDYVVALSPEERETHKDLIAESLERQRAIRENTAASYELLRKINEDYAKIAANLRQLGAMISAGLEEQNASMQYTIGKLSDAREKLSHPDKNFYKA